MREGSTLYRGESVVMGATWTGWSSKASTVVAGTGFGCCPSAKEVRSVPVLSRGHGSSNTAAR
jgi:hypothetical protein